MSHPSSTPERTPVPPPPGVPGPRAGGGAAAVAGPLVKKLATIAITVLVMVGAAWYLVARRTEDTVRDSLPAVGACFSWTDVDGAKALPCSQDSALYKVEAQSVETTAATSCDKAGGYVTFQVDVYERSQHSTGTICAALNLREGDCVASMETSPERVDCAKAVPSDLKVLALKPVTTATEAMSSDKAHGLCPASSTTFLSDTAGKTVVCLGKSV